MTFLRLITTEGAEVDVNPREVALVEGMNLAETPNDQPRWETTLTLTTGGKKLKVTGDMDGPRTRREIADALARAAR